MNNIYTIEQTQNITSRNPGAKIVLVGGCFDLIHIGHIQFLSLAKQQGDILIVILESDSSVKKKKGVNRPINAQRDRALLLSELRSVDYVLLLPEETSDKTYIEVTKLLKPAIIAITSGDPHLAQKKNAAEKVGAQIIEVTPLINDQSTSRLARLLEKEKSL
ncbi:MAG TPA: adenylyltransferase/cytidyltransferase family protein [Patescibacteria group bacterium]|nr:adenylyltransferase/cytidyltransferase family protein [Patescibacteria group bacterium]